MNINEAQAIIQAEADKLTDAIRTKGYAESTAEIWVGREGTDKCVIYLSGDGQHMYVPQTNNLAQMVAQARAEIARWPHRDAEAMAYADELAQPLFLMSEQSIAQAAE